jgi:hypothetical protein
MESSISCLFVCFFTRTCDTLAYPPQVIASVIFSSFACQWILQFIFLEDPQTVFFALPQQLHNPLRVIFVIERGNVVARPISIIPFQGKLAIGIEKCVD